MRPSIRLLSVALSATALASCMDVLQGTAPGNSRVSLALTPHFSQSATLASATLAEAGLTYTSVRVVIVRPPSDTLKDTTIAFSPTSPEVTLELSIAAVPSEILEAGVQFRNGDDVIFSGKATVKALSPTVSSVGTPVDIEVDYTGPGATATSVTIQPGAGIYSATTTTQFTAKVFASTTELTGVPVFWSISDESRATVSATGLLTPKGQRGSFEVTATSANGIAKTIAVQLAPSSSGLRVVQGASQKGPAGSQLPSPVIVELFAADGGPAAAAGQSITFSAVTAGGSITPTTTTLDANARAQATMTVGGSAGTTYLYKAKVGSDSVMWGGYAAPGTPTQFVPSGPTTFSMTAGVSPDPVPTLRLADAQGNPVPNQFLKVTMKKNGVLLPNNPFVVPADSIGLLDVYKVAPTVAGSYTILVELDGSTSVPSVTYTITVNPGAIAKLAFSVQPSNVVVGQAVTPAVKVEVQDQFGNLVTSASGSMTMTIDAATGAGVSQTGTGTETVTGGVATFANLRFSAQKTGMKIQAAAFTKAALSAAFNITP
jgi:hypothetical protein